MHRNFFFTGYHYDSKQNKVFCRGYKSNGEPISTAIKFKPFCFIRGNGDYRDFHDKTALIRKDFDSYHELEKYVRNNRGKCFGMGINEDSCNRSELLYAFIVDVFQEKIDWNFNSIKILNYDIETTMEHNISISDMLGNNNPVEAILSIACSITVNGLRQYKVFSCFEEAKDIEEHILCFDEGDMLKKFCEFVGTEKPDIISGWNCQKFDSPYLFQRICNYYDGEWLKNFSVFGIEPKQLTKRKKNRKTGQEEQYLVIDFPGTSELDYMSLYDKFNPGYNGSLKLNVVAELELGEKKLDYSEEGSLKNLYKTNKRKFIEYNIKDVKLVDRLNDKLRYFGLALTITFLSKTRFEDVYGSVRVWDILIYDYLINHMQRIIPRHGDEKKTSQNRGGKVKDSKIGISKNVVTIDSASHYPSICIGLNISPETFVRKINLRDEDVIEQVLDLNFLKEQDFGMAGNGCLFSKSVPGVLSTIIESIFNMRVEAKKQMKAEINKGKEADQFIISKFDAIQHALKILINSAYGILASEYCRYFNKDLAEAITVTGQVLTISTDKIINRFLNDYLGNDQDKDYIVLSDTDSCGVCLDEVLIKNGIVENTAEFMIDFVDNHINPVIEEELNKLMQYMNFYKPSIRFNREKVCDKIIVTAKKRYAAAVLNNEGFMYDSPKIIVKGIEVVRSNTPEMVRKALKECLEIILTQDEPHLQQYVKNFKKKFMSSSAEDIAIPIGVNAMEKYQYTQDFADKTPAAVKAAITYNNYVKKMGYTDLDMIESGEKIKTVILKIPNRFGNDRMACKTFFDKRFGIDKEIDYIKMYENTFIEPLQRLTDKIEWQIEKKNLLIM
jgi:DNA polymerase elongation subunit (family B)